VIARKKGSLTAAEEVLLDESERAPQSGHYSVGSWVVSPNGRLLAWTEDHVGRLQYELHVKDLQTGRISQETGNGLSANILWVATTRPSSTLSTTRSCAHSGSRRTFSAPPRAPIPSSSTSRTIRFIRCWSVRTTSSSFAWTASASWHRSGVAHR